MFARQSARLFRILLLALPLCGGPLAPAAAGDAAAVVQAQPSRERARMNQRVFDRVWSEVRRGYYDPTLHGVDWRAARERFRPQALAATDDRSLYRVLNQMLDLLDDSHARASSAAMARRQDTQYERRAVLGLSLMADEQPDVWIVERVRPDSPAEAAGVQVGWSLHTVDGRPWGPDVELVDGRAVQLVLTDEAGVRHETVVIPRLMDGFAPFTADRSNPGVLVLRVERFGEGLGRWIGRELEGLASDVDVILDLRGNPGGQLREAESVLTCFLPRDQAWATRTGRTGRAVVLKASGDCAGRREPVTNDLAVLVDHVSRSAAELTPQALQEAGRAVVVGEQTVGSVLIAQDTDLPDGGRLTLSRADYITSGGVRLEKRGVTPDILAPRTLVQRRAGQDPTLAAAIAALADDEQTARGPDTVTQ